MPAYFVSVPKTASVTIHSMSSNRWLRYNHYLASQIKELVPDWDTAFTFAFVRNPYDRLVSWFFGHTWLARDKNTAHNSVLYGQTFDEWVANGCRHHWNVPFNPLQQVSFIDIPLTFIGRYEKLQEDYEHIANNIGLPKRRLDLLNNSYHDDWRTYYNKDIYMAIRPLVQADCEQFGYQIL